MIELPDPITGHEEHNQQQQQQQQQRNNASSGFQLLNWVVANFIVIDGFLSSGNCETAIRLPF